MVLRREKSITRGIERGGPWISRLFWALMALLSLVVISGPKTSLDFQSPALPMPFILALARLKTITYRAI
jgi:hypothetical protein